jgi:gluconolactonase
MRIARSLLAVVVTTCASVAVAQTGPFPGPGSIIRPPALPQAQMRGDGPPPAPTQFALKADDPSFWRLISPKTQLVELAHGFGLNEGPVWMPDGGQGYVLVSGLLDNVIYKVTPDKTVSVFMDFAGYTGTDPEHSGAQTRSGRNHVLLIGPSCTGRDPQGRLVWCADNDRMVMRLEKDGTRRVLSAGYRGKRFSGPNDISVAPDGAIYLADNDFGLRDAGKSNDKQMSGGVFLIKDGVTTKLIDAADLGGIANGITLSHDGKMLYVSAGFSRMLRYPVKDDGTLGSGAEFTTGPGMGDGMKTDLAGNVYSTNGGGPGAVRVTNPAGKQIGTINLPVYGGEPKRQICATNVAFGGPDGKTLFITACDAVFSLRMNVAGLTPAQLKP